MVAFQFELAKRVVLPFTELEPGPCAALSSVRVRRADRNSIFLWCLRFHGTGLQDPLEHLSKLLGSVRARRFGLWSSGLTHS